MGELVREASVVEKAIRKANQGARNGSVQHPESHDPTGGGVGSPCDDTPDGGLCGYPKCESVLNDGMSCLLYA